MELPIDKYTYDLPAEKIALHPLPERDQTKLLIYEKGEIKHTHFQALPNYLPANTSLFFNNTRVIPARIYFTKETGATIEVFLLNPIKPSTLLIDGMQATGTCTWKCAIGNKKKWQLGKSVTIRVEEVELIATLSDKTEDIVEFSWASNHTFAEVLTRLGKTPLPPYLKRESNEDDKQRYQTIFAKHDGAVAAPTAGLHFSKQVMQVLKEKGVKINYLTLHVSAGTFQPIKSADASAHTMHEEQVIVDLKTIENLLHSDFVIPVGTTSMRTLESLFWFGMKLCEDLHASFIIHQNDPYERSTSITKAEALRKVLDYMLTHNMNDLVGSTAIFIKPGYQFRICNGLITNFHQPASTLILLVAALIGDDWKKVYGEALHNDYRFLSYGDSSLLLPSA